MALEIERKFVVKVFPSHLTPSREPTKVYQGYLSTNPDYEVRISNRLHLTTKRGGGLVREEIILDITEEMFKTLWPLTEGSRIEKTRHYYDLDGLLGELDVYDDCNEGLMVIEVEFTSIQQSEDFVPPEWFGKDITLDPEFKNAALAK